MAPLKYDVPTATASLLSMVISEVGDEFAARRVPVPARARKVESSMPMEFELGIPCNLAESKLLRLRVALIALQPHLLLMLEVQRTSYQVSRATRRRRM